MFDFQSKTKLLILLKKKDFNGSTPDILWKVSIKETEVYNKIKSDLKIRYIRRSVGNGQRNLDADVDGVAPS